MSDTTTTSEPRPVSALEQTLRDKFRLNIVGTWLFQEAADLVHERDTQFYALCKQLLAGEIMSAGHAESCIRAILEGRAQP